MKVVIEVQTDLVGSKFLDAHNETVEIYTCRDKLIVNRELEMLVIPIEVFRGVKVT